MIKKILNVGHYSFDFFENRKLPSFYSCIIFKNDKNHRVFKEFESIKVSDEKKIYRVYNVPPYLDLLLESTNTYHKIVLPEIDKGLLVDISKFTTIEDFATQQFSSRKRKQIRSALKRADTCFNISYKFYYGNIDKEKYHFLLNATHKFITRRFNQINKKHYHLSHWDLIKENTYKLILEKKASIFVIYDNDKPINICFNYHFNKTTCNVLASYDIDYAKFSLGTIDLYKQLEWNINNNFSVFDMSIGESDYKLKWCNNYYELNHNIIIKKKSVVSNLVGLSTYCYLKLKFHLFRYHYKHPNSKWLSFLSKSIQDPANDTIEKDYKPLEIESTTIGSFDFETNKIKVIDIETKTYAFLRKPFYDFLHANPELKNNVPIYKLNDEENSYIIKGTNKTQKLIITQ